MTLAIIGSCNCPPIDILAQLTKIPDTIVSGGARGVDAYAREFAKAHGLRMIEYFPDYERYGRIAPLIRNRSIIDDCDCVLAFWDGHSRGTKAALDYAKEQQKPIKIVEI